jgi:hypothetical protein
MSHIETDEIDSSQEFQDSDDDYEYEYIDQDEETGSVKKREEIDYRLLVEDREAFGSCLSAAKQFATPSATNLRGFHCQSRECCWSCGGEHHAPVASCKLATAWVRGEVDMPFGITILPSDYVVPAMRFHICEYAKQFGHSEEESALIIQQQGWNNENHRPRVTLDAQQEFLDLTVAESNVKQLQCGICMDDFDLDEMFSLGCNHTFCSTCWRQYLATKFEGNFGGMEALRVACPQPSCSELVCEQHVRKVAPDLIPSFEQHLLDSFVKANRSVMMWCPGPDCKRIAIKPRDDLYSPYVGNIAVCHGKDGCKKSFCFLCGEEPHDGLCQHLQKEPIATTDTTRLAVTNSLIAAAQLADAKRTVATVKIQLCPTCKTPIEKNGGCNHITCKCGTHFCWLCNADITDVRYNHSCGRHRRDRETTRQPQQRRQVNLDYIHDALEWKKAREDEENNKGRSCCNPIFRRCSEALAARVFRRESNDGTGNDTIDTASTSFMLESVIKHKGGIEQFAHFYKRFVAHQQGQHFAEGQCACVRSRRDDFTQISGMKSATDTDFFVEANQLLVASRRVLKNSYCYVYSIVKQTETSEVRVAAAQNKPGDKKRKMQVHDYEDDDSDNEADASLQLDLFQSHQEQLERFTEQLSEVTERAFNHVQRQRVLELMEIVSRLMETVISFEREESSKLPFVK